MKYDYVDEYGFKEDYSYLDGVIDATLAHEKVKNASKFLSEGKPLFPSFFVIVIILLLISFFNLL